MANLHKKLKRLKISLKEFNKAHYEDISKKVDMKKKELEAIQMLILTTGVGGDQIEKERDMFKELHDLMVAEESFFRQKSRIQWLQEGDHNTRFFHSMVATRQHKNSINSLTDSNGNKLVTFADISNEAVTFFQKLIGTVDGEVVG